MKRQTDGGGPSKVIMKRYSCHKLCSCPSCGMLGSRSQLPFFTEYFPDIETVQREVVRKHERRLEAPEWLEFIKCQSCNCIWVEIMPSYECVGAYC